jgi:hypothetical protein
VAVVLGGTWVGDAMFGREARVVAGGGDEVDGESEAIDERMDGKMRSDCSE